VQPASTFPAIYGGTVLGSDLGLASVSDANKDSACLIWRREAAEAASWCVARCVGLAELSGWLRPKRRDNSAKLPPVYRRQSRAAISRPAAAERS
jgi:hypothetical protein